MKIAINVCTAHTRQEFLALALKGLRSVNDEGEEFIAALEAVVGDTHCVTDAEVWATHQRHARNLSATARALGMPRSTVRYRLARLDRLARAVPLPRAANYTR